MILPVTLAIAAAAAVINLWLAFRIVPTRLRHGVVHGDAGNQGLLRRMRAQANFTEYAPIVLILLGLLEFAGVAPTWLWVLGVAFVLARIVHALGMDREGPNPLRAGGALTTWVVTSLLAGWAVALVWQAERTVPARIVPVDAAEPRA